MEIGEPEKTVLPYLLVDSRETANTVENKDTRLISVGTTQTGIQTKMENRGTIIIIIT